MSPAVVDSVGGICVFRGKMGDRSAVLAKSGMGAERAEVAASTLIESVHPKALIIAGFCGGLLDEPGQLVIPDLVLDDRRNGIDGELRPNADMLAQAHATYGVMRQSPQRKLLTAQRILRTKAEKQLACRDARTFHAVDMETFGAAEAAIRAGVPWLAVRAVTDGQLDEMPLDFSHFKNEEGEVQRGRIALAMLARPWKIPAMITLGIRSFRAARNLAEFVERYVAEL